MKYLSSFLSGLLFAIGLGLSGMMNPLKVRNFLGITRIWDPALAFVMVGAIAVYAVAFRLIRKRSKPICELNFSLPNKTKLEPRLIIGAALFGVGWGIAGFCPGPAIANLATGLIQALVFVSIMIASIAVIKFLEQKNEAS